VAHLHLHAGAAAPGCPPRLPNRLCCAAAAAAAAASNPLKGREVTHAAASNPLKGREVTHAAAPPGPAPQLHAARGASAAIQVKLQNSYTP
jgi:hypothetical protein